MSKISTLPLMLLAATVLSTGSSRPAFSQTATAVVPDDGSAKSRLDRDIPALLRETGVPSVSIAQIVGGQTAVLAAYGEQEPGVPATPATLYNIASLTKPLTAEVALRLMSAGRLDLDEPLASYWVDPDLIRDERNKLLTLRLALSHQTGFPNWRDPKDGLKFLHDPGTNYGYSGEGYNYAVRFIQKKTGSNFEDLASQMLFGPLGMVETAYTGKSWFDHRIAIPTDAKGKLLEPHIPKNPSGADAVYTTARDYARFMVAVINDEGVSTAVARERNRPQASMMLLKCQGEKTATCPLYTGYGLGWQILLFPNQTVMMHTGDDEGVRTFVYIDRSTREGAVILTNGENGNALILPILERLGTPSVILNYVGSQYH
jgi:CubicO group peptidase (beta-lactamase class C family)